MTGEQDQVRLKIYKVVTLIYIFAPILGESTIYYGSGKLSPSLLSSFLISLSSGVIYLWFYLQNNFTTALILNSVLQLGFFSWGLLVAGGIYAEHIIYIAIFPIINGFFLGKKAVILTTIYTICFAILLGLLRHYELDHIHQHSLLTLTIQIVSCLLFIGLIIMIYENERLKKQAQLQNISEILKIKTNSLNILIESLDDIIFEVNQKGVFLNVWARDEKKLFTTKENIINNNYKNIFPDFFVDKISTYIEKSIVTGKQQSFVYQNPFIEDLNSSPWFRCKINYQGKKYNENIFTMVITDITEEVKAKEKLDNTSQELNQFFNVSVDLLCIASLDGKFKKLNPSFTKILGYHIDELKDKDIIDFVHPDDKSKTLNEINKIKKGIPSFNFENRYLSKDENYITLSWVAMPDLKNGIMYASARDITDIKKVENNLKQAQEVAKIGSWNYNIQTTQINWSEEMYKIFPQPDQQIAPTLDDQVLKIHPDDYQIWKTAFDQCITEGTPYRIRIKSCMNNDIIWVEAIGNAIRNHLNQIVEVTGTCQNITDLINAEELVKVEKAKSLQNAKLASLGEMSAGIAHEINNPLAIIAGNVELLKNLKDNEEKFKQKTDSILKAVLRITKIVNGLKKFSRISSQEAQSPQLLADIINESVELSETKAHLFNTDIKLNIQTSGYILCDKIEIEQVLINLISNSIDAVKNQVEKWIEINAFEKTNEIVIQVIDSGQKFSNEIEKKLFQPFFTTKPVGEGTGLGLSVAKGILDQHNASITVNPKMPTTCFEIHFKKYNFPTTT